MSYVRIVLTAAADDCRRQNSEFSNNNIRNGIVKKGTKSNLWLITKKKREKEKCGGMAHGTSWRWQTRFQLPENMRVII